MRVSSKYKGLSKKRHMYVSGYGIKFENMEYLTYSKKQMLDIRTLNVSGVDYIFSLSILNINNPVSTSNKGFGILEQPLAIDRINEGDITSIYVFYSNGTSSRIPTLFIDKNPYEWCSSNILQTKVLNIGNYDNGTTLGIQDINGCFTWNLPEVKYIDYSDMGYMESITLNSNRYKDELINIGYSVIVEDTANQEV